MSYNDHNLSIYRISNGSVTFNQSITIDFSLSAIFVSPDGFKIILLDYFYSKLIIFKFNNTQFVKTSTMNTDDYIFAMSLSDSGLLGTISYTGGKSSIISINDYNYSKISPLLEDQYGSAKINGDGTVVVHLVC